MKKFLSLILIPALLLCGCSKSSDAPSTLSFFAMDTTIEFNIYGNESLAKDAQSVITDLEKKVSVTDSDSEIYKINQNGCGTLIGNANELMQEALNMCKLTNGALDISIYPIVRAWGFTTGDYQVPDDNTIQNCYQW